MAPGSEGQDYQLFKLSSAAVSLTEAQSARISIDINCYHLQNQAAVMMLLFCVQESMLRVILLVTVITILWKWAYMYFLVTLNMTQIFKGAHLQALPFLHETEVTRTEGIVYHIPFQHARQECQKCNTWKQLQRASYGQSVLQLARFHGGLGKKRKFQINSMWIASFCWMTNRGQHRYCSVGSTVGIFASSKWQHRVCKQHPVTYSRRNGMRWWRMRLV